MIPKSVNYQPSTDEKRECETCRWFERIPGTENGRCRMFDGSKVDEDYVCDKWQGRTTKRY